MSNKPHVAAMPISPARVEHEITRIATAELLTNREYHFSEKICCNFVRSPLTRLRRRQERSSMRGSLNALIGKTAAMGGYH
jgi:hypothetical protein